MAVLRKIKEKFRKLIQKQKNFPDIVGKRREKTAKKISLKESPKETPKEALGIQEMAVEKTKFSTPEAPRITPRLLEDLPLGYGEDKIVLQVRDTRWIHAYWEITLKAQDNLRERLKNVFYEAKRVLRVYDVSHIIFDGTNAHRFFDIEVGREANNWYIDTNGPGRSWCVDIGLRLASGEFIRIARSNTVHTPIEGPSWITDEEWMVPDDMFARLYGMGFGFGKSSPVGKAWQERVKRVLFSGILASPGITSVASPVKKIPKARQFWLVLNTELIVYGATEPDARVTVQGRPLTLRPDGTFSLRFALPDGKQVIAVEATSTDNIETRTITPIITRETKYNSSIRE